MWHTNIGLAEPDGSGGRTYPTRAHFTGDGVLHELAGFTTEQHIQSVAAHELGHFLVDWTLGAWMQSIHVQDGGGNIIPKGMVAAMWSAENGWQRSRLIGGAAGERACDRWLREQGLWTPARAVCCEIQGQDDRAEAHRVDPSITFDGGPNDYRHLQDAADRVLDDVWPLLLQGMKHFSGYARYSGDAMCILLGVRNNPDPR